MSEIDGRYQEPLSSRMKWVLITFTAIGAFFLFAEHRAHVLPYLPWLLLGSCLLMHGLMHGGHGHGHGGHGDHDGPQAGSERTAGAASPAGNSHSHPLSVRQFRNSDQQLRSPASRTGRNVDRSYHLQDSQS